MKFRNGAIHLVLSLLIALAALPASATFSGKNGRIAFIQGPDIYTMNPDGSDVKQLTDLGPDDFAAWESWSPDGKQIVFNEYHAPTFLGELWLMNPDGSNKHPLLAEDDFDNERPSFTPDGTSVVFSRCRLDIEACGLHQIGVNGTGLTAITKFSLGIQDLSAQHSPVGNPIAFTGVARGGIICAIYLTTSAWPKLPPLTPASLSARQPDWSPDGTKIAFSTHCRNPQNEEIWTVDSKGGVLQRLTTNGHEYFAGPHDFHPSWSPEGNAIVFERDAPDFSGFGIFIMKPNGSGSQKLLEVKTSARRSIQRIRELHKHDNRALNRRLKQIEDGGAMPRWGVAPI